MGLFERLAKRRGYVKGSDYEIGGRDSISQLLAESLTGWAGQGLSPTDVADLEESYQRSVWVYAAVYAVGMAGAMVPLQATLRSRRNGSATDTPLPDAHPLTALLAEPNKDTSLVEFVEIMLEQAELAGASYWIIERNRAGRPAVLLPVKPSEMRVHVGPLGIERFEFSSRGRSRTLETRDVIYYRYVDPLRPFLGASPSEPCSIALDTDRAAAKWNRNYFRNSAIPAVTVETDEAGPENPVKRAEWLRALRMGWQQAFQGTERAWQTVILTNGLKAKPLSPPIGEMQFEQLRRMNREEILAVRGVPPIMVGVLEGNTFANAAMQKQQFWQDTMLPKLTKLGHVLTRQLAAQFDSAITLAFDTSGVDSLHENVDAKAKRGQILVTSMQWTPNEAREKLWQLPPVVGGDSLVPRSPFVTTGPVIEPKAPDRSPAVKRVLAKSAARARSAIERHVGGATRAFGAYLREQGKRFAEAVKGGAMSAAEIMDMEAERAALTPIIADRKTVAVVDGWKAGGVAIDEARKAAGLPMRKAAVTGEGVVSEQVAGYIARQATIKSKYITEETFSALKGILESGVREGGTIAEMRDRIVGLIEDSFDGQADYRAERIARTELLGAYNYGNQQAMTDAGLTRHVWSSSQDEDVRESHLIDGESAEIGEEFSNGVVIPSEEGPLEEIIQCRCTTIVDETELLGG